MNAICLARRCIPFVISAVVFVGCAQSEPTIAPPSAAKTEHPSQVSTSSEQPSQDDVVEIPLDQIWAVDMPGTTKLSGGQFASGEYATPGGEYVKEILTKALPTLKKGELPRSGFAVLGVGVDAIRAAHAVLVKDEHPSDAFPANSNINVVFFSHEYGESFHVHDVKRRGKVITVNYQIVPHLNKELTSHFAVIPMGSLPSNNYLVRFVRIPTESPLFQRGFKPAAEGVDALLVCQAFKFVVRSSSGN